MNHELVAGCVSISASADYGSERKTVGFCKCGFWTDDTKEMQSHISGAKEG